MQYICVLFVESICMQFSRLETTFNQNTAAQFCHFFTLKITFSVYLINFHLIQYGVKFSETADLASFSI